MQSWVHSFATQMSRRWSQERPGFHPGTFSAVPPGLILFLVVDRTQDCVLGYFQPSPSASSGPSLRDSMLNRWFACSPISPVHLLLLVTAQDILKGHHALEGALAGPILNGENRPTGQVGNRAV